MRFLKTLIYFIGGNLPIILIRLTVFHPLVFILFFLSKLLSIKLVVFHTVPGGFIDLVCTPDIQDEDFKHLINFINDVRALDEEENKDA